MRKSGGIAAILLALAGAPAAAEYHELGEMEWRRMLWRCASFMVMAMPEGNEHRIIAAQRAADRGRETSYWLPESSAIFAEIASELETAEDDGTAMIERYWPICRPATDWLLRQQAIPDLEPPIPARARRIVQRGSHGERPEIRPDAKIRRREGRSIEGPLAAGAAPIAR